MGFLISTRTSVLIGDGGKGAAPPGRGRSQSRFTWAMALLADAAVLLRARVLLGQPPSQSLLAGLMPRQLPLKLTVESDERLSPETNWNP